MTGVTGVTGVVLVRHGETVPNRRGVLLGRDDPPLTERGERQAEALARLLVGSEPTAVVSSPLTRCRDTARVVGDACSLDVDVDERLVEIDYGDWEGRPLGEIPDELSDRWRADPGFRPPGGESLADVQERVGSWCEALPAGGGTVVAVSHVSPIKAAVAWALGVDPGVSWRMWVEVASVTRLRVRPGGGMLLGFNELAHLEGVE